MPGARTGVLLAALALCGCGSPSLTGAAKPPTPSERASVRTCLAGHGFKVPRETFGAGLSDARFLLTMKREGEAASVYTARTPRAARRLARTHDGQAIDVLVVIAFDARTQADAADAIGSCSPRAVG